MLTVIKVLALVTSYSLLLYGCSMESPSTEVTKLRYLDSVSELSDSTYLYSVSSITAKNDAMYVVERSTNRIITLKLGSNEVLSSFGAAGSGPKEFRYISTFVETPDTLFVFDTALKSTKLFTKEGRFIDARKISIKSSFSRVGLYKNILFSMGAENPQKVLVAQNIHTQEKYFEFDDTIRKNESIKNIPILKRYDRRYIVVVDTFVVSFPVGEFFGSVSTVTGKKIGRYELMGHDFFSSNKALVEAKYAVGDKEKRTAAVFGDVTSYKDRIYCLFYDRRFDSLSKNKVGVFEISPKGLVLKKMYELSNNGEGFYMSITVEGDTIYAFDNKTKEIQSFKVPDTY